MDWLGARAQPWELWVGWRPTTGVMCGEEQGALEGWAVFPAWNLLEAAASSA